MSSYLFALLLVYILLSLCNTEKVNPLNGKNLRLIAMEYPSALMTERNATGHIISFDGNLKQHLLTLARMFNFSYTFLPIFAPLFEPVPTAPKGGLYYLMSDEADWVLGPAVATPFGLQNSDYPASWTEGKFMCIVPYPREKDNIAASLKPLSYEVWIATVVAIIVAIIYLRFSMKDKFKKTQLKSSNWNGDTLAIGSFVLRNLVSQGQTVYSTHLAFRIAAGAWCCGCFFLVNIYCSTLTSHLTSPNQKPIANTAEELVNTPGLDFTAQIHYGVDFTIQQAKVGVLKNLADNINRDPRLRCKEVDDCLKIVRDGYAGYGSVRNSLYSIMHDDLKSTGRCNYYLLKDVYLRLQGYTPLQKNSPYMEIISVGILRLQQGGFSNYWDTWYDPKPSKCLEIINHRDKVPRLSINHLSSAFIILLTGYVCSFVAFIFEKIRSRMTKPTVI